MRTKYQVAAFLITAVLVILFLAATMGCRTVATHDRVKDRYVLQARENVRMGRGPLCTVDGKTKRIELLGFWEMVMEHWPEYGEAVLTDVATALIIYLAYEAQDDDVGGGAPAAGDTIYNYYQPAEATGGAAE